MSELFDLAQYQPDDVRESLFLEISYRPKQLELDVLHLKEWLKSQEHLPPSKLKENDFFLKMFLTGCKGSMETAKRKLDYYYSYRGRSEIYRNRDVLNVDYRKSCDRTYVVTLPQITATGNYIIICKLMTSVPNEYDQLNSVKRLVNMLEMCMRLRDLNAPTYVIIDWQKFTSAHTLNFSPGLFKDTIILMQDVFPTRVKMIFMISVHPALEMMVNTLIKPFFTKKVRERTVVTSEGSEVLQKYIDRSLLPKDYGGDGKTLKEYNDLWNEYEKSLSDWFINELSEETDESKRIDVGGGHILDHDSYFGVQGSLKKLAID